MSKKVSTSLQPRPGRVTRKGTRPNPTALNNKKPGRNRPASGFDPITKEWNGQAH